MTTISRRSLVDHYTVKVIYFVLNLFLWNLLVDWTTCEWFQIETSWIIYSFTYFSTEYIEPFDGYY